MNKEMNQAVCNYDFAMRNTGNDIELLEEIIDIFLTSCDSMIEDLEQAVGSQDASAIRLLAHKYKGTLASLGATLSAETASKLQLIAEEDDLSDAKPLFSLLKKQLEELRIELESVKASVRNNLGEGAALLLIGAVQKP
jgi:HPt (histidine-containing phosphotransfer) domain-containing protein